MPRFSVRLTKVVEDTLDRFIEVDADDADAAGPLALAMAEQDPGDWQVAHEGEGSAPEVDRVDLIPAPDPLDALASLLADAESEHGGRAAHGMPVEDPEHPWHKSILAARAALAAAGRGT